MIQVTWQVRFNRSTNKWSVEQVMASNEDSTDIPMYWHLGERVVPYAGHYYFASCEHEAEAQAARLFMEMNTPMHDPLYIDLARELDRSWYQPVILPLSQRDFALHEHYLKRDRLNFAAWLNQAKRIARTYI